MKPLQIGLLVLAGALGGAVIMKFTQRPKVAPAPVAGAVPAAAPVPAAPVPTAPVATPAPLPEATAELPKIAKSPATTPARPAKPARQRHEPPTTVAQNLPPAQPAPPAQPVREESSAPPIAVQSAPPPADTPAPPTEPTPPAAPEPAPSVTLAVGIALPVRLGQRLSSENNQTGDTFIATLDAPLSAGGFVIAERGARVEGRVIDAQKSGHVKGKAILALELTKLHTSDGQQVDIKTETLRHQATTMAKQDQVGIVAAAAGIGAVIGAIAGGGKGAAIGAGAGGAAGTGGVIATRDREITLPNEAKMTFRLATSVTLTERLNQ